MPTVVENEVGEYLEVALQGSDAAALTARKQASKQASNGDSIMPKDQVNK